MTNSFPGGASFVNRKLFERLGLYDAEMFIGFEDFELGIRGIRFANPVKARLIHNIELVHDHRQAKKSEDKKAVLTRYDVHRHEASFNRITEKHNIIFESDWENWIDNQVEKTFKKDDISFKKSEKILKQSKKTVVSFASFVLPYRAKEIIKRLLHYTPIPIHCSLFMTDRCNFRCQGCYRSVIGVKESKEMTLTTVEKLLSLYASIDAFCIAGLGEPTLCPDFVDIVDFLRSNEKYVGVITNGTNLTTLLALTYEPNYISISLKGYDNVSYLVNAGVAAFDTVMATFSELKSSYKNVGFSYIVNRTNYKDLAKVLPLCDDLKPDFLHLTNYLVYDPMVKEEVQKIITVKDSEIIDYINVVCAEREYIRLKPVYVDFDNPEFNCRSYDYVINLDGAGNIGGCQRQIPPDAYFGNIFTDKDPYNTSELRRLRDLTHRNCYAHNECRFCFGNWEP